MTRKAVAFIFQLSKFGTTLGEDKALRFQKDFFPAFRVFRGQNKLRIVLQFNDATA
jgi:hypothetical protein